jgi:two-component system OmpR family sensor kinase
VTLRARLVGGLVLLMIVGLVLFGWVTYGLYSSSQYRQLDAQLNASVPSMVQELARVGDLTAGLAPGEGSGPPPGQGQSPAGPDGEQGRPFLVPPGTYGELLTPSGAVVSHVQPINTGSQPKLPAQLPATGQRGKIFTVGTYTGSSSWRVFVGPALAGSYRVVVAVPMKELTSSLDHLVAIEVVGGLSLLVALSLGAALLLRRGLAPMEHMAATADLISAGDLSQRVQPLPASSEVGKLALALNGMLDQIELVFAQRDATEARLRQFLADASHELKTPLTSIQGFAELFRLGSDQVDTETVMRRVESESARMKGLVEGLLLLARLDEVRQPQRSSVDLSVLAADACSDAVAMAPDRQVTLSAPLPVVVSGDQAHLRQAVSNLISNAVRHTPAGSPIDVAVGLDSGRARLSVRDHGEGLDEEALAHAFDRFWQKDPSRAGAGSGLGLSIVEAIALEHGGRATADNAQDGGAVFTIELPIGPSPEPRTGEGDTKQSTGRAPDTVPAR